jgi:hypothetical protein
LSDCHADGLIFDGGTSGDVMGSVLGDGCVIEFSELTGFVVVGSCRCKLICGGYKEYDASCFYSRWNSYLYSAKQLSTLVNASSKFF